jgi:hypothetical protein
MFRALTVRSPRSDDRFADRLPEVDATVTMRDYRQHTEHGMRQEVKVLTAVP